MTHKSVIWSTENIKVEIAVKNLSLHISVELRFTNCFGILEKSQGFGVLQHGTDEQLGKREQLLFLISIVVFFSNYLFYTPVSKVCFGHKVQCKLLGIENSH